MRSQNKKYEEKLFERANSFLSIQTILPSGKKSGGEWISLNPKRSDNSEGSFKINMRTHKWSDFATGDKGGDLLSLYSYLHDLDYVEAARQIINNNEFKQMPTKKKKPVIVIKKKENAIFPIPEEAKKKFQNHIQSKFQSEKYGDHEKSWSYKNKDGKPLFIMSRYLKDGKKNIIPCYYSNKGWRNGMPPIEKYPLFNLNEITKTKKKILLVEGEKCAEIRLDNLVVTTWAGGVNRVHLADWSPIKNKEVIIWPDNDDEGLKAALKISMELNKYIIIPIPSEKPKKWDIADAKEEGLNIIEFIKERINQKKKNDELAKEEDPTSNKYLPIIPLGTQNNFHFFLKKNTRTIIKIKFGSWNRSKCIELASINTWTNLGFTNKQEKIVVDDIQDFLTRKNEKIGYFDQERIKGVGAWNLKGDIFLNTGKNIYSPAKSTSITESDILTNHKFLFISGKKFSKIDEFMATNNEIQKIQSLCQSQKFVSAFSPVALMGWSLLAPFGGALHWRPIIWVTGKKGTGKSWIFENIISPLLGKFVHESSGKGTEAGIRESVDSCAMPCLLDEVDAQPNTHDHDKIIKIMSLARNACNDTSAKIQMSSGNNEGKKVYFVHSMFAFASVTIPLSESAFLSRILKLELSPKFDPLQKGDNYISIDDELGARVRRRTWEFLPKILILIKEIKKLAKNYEITMREADVISPLISAYWYSLHDRPPEEEEILVELERYFKSKENIALDENIYFDYIMSHLIQINPVEKETVAQMIQSNIHNLNNNYEKLLSQIGIRIENKILYIACRHPRLIEIFRKNKLPENYQMVISRHKALIDEKRKRMRFAGNLFSCLRFDIDNFLNE